MNVRSGVVTLHERKLLAATTLFLLPCTLTTKKKKILFIFCDENLHVAMVSSNYGERKPKTSQPNARPFKEFFLQFLFKPTPHVWFFREKTP